LPFILIDLDGERKWVNSNKMKKVFNKIGQVLQLVLAAPVKLPGKVGNILKYVAIGLGILETVLDEEEPPPEVNKPFVDSPADFSEERSGADETE